MNFKHTVYLFLTTVILAACSTEKDAWLNRTYHNTTAHYNGYWNAKEIIKETNYDFERSYVENYEEILPVYIFPNEEESKNFKSPMDTAVKKCEVVIFKHSMPAKKVGQYRKTEWCDWIDDNWFAIGESQFYKRDFEESEKRFKYIEKQYSTKSISFDALLWQAKIQIEKDNLPAARSILDELQDQIDEENDKTKDKEEKEAEKAKKKKAKARNKKRKGPRGKKKKSTKKDQEEEEATLGSDFEKQYYPVLADYHLRKKEYAEASVALEKSIEIVKDRQFKTRLIFILAQLNHKQNNGAASDLYAEVVKRNPKYDMAFIAKINKALAFSGGDKKGIKAELKKMLKDEKNVDYLDQIYYALADIELTEGNTPQGIEYLESSISYSVSNPNQKSKSFLKLGKLYYAGKEYIKAQKYYDSTLTALDKEHPEYANIEFQNKSLTELVTNLNLANHQDSLLNLCALSVNDLEKKIFKIIDTEEERIQAEKIAAEQASLTPSGGGNLAAKGDFWAFNEKLRNNGFEKFKNVWGPRPLSDDWRRSDKSSTNFDDEQNGGSEEVKDPKLTVEFYTKDLPCGKPSMEEKAKEDIITGYYNAARVYKQKLFDLEASLNTFQKLEPYLPHDKSIEGLYQSYLICNETNQNSKAETFKQKLLNDHPNSEYAKILKDPRYLEESGAAEKAEEKIYTKVYDKFLLKQYVTVVKEIDDRLKIGDTPYQCKYMYMKALALGYSNKDPKNLKPIEAALEDVVANCDDDVIKNQAQTTLDKLRNKQSILDAQSGNSKYIYSTESKHFFVLVFPNGSGSVNQAKAKVSDLNIASFSNDGLQTKSSFLDADNQLITVRTFKDKDAAMDYYLTFKVNKNQVSKLQEFEYFVITDKNFSVLFLEKDIPEYLEFFQKSYLK